MATNEIISSVLDTEKLISEVEKRPALYNKYLKEYSDKNLKDKLWEEVYCNVVNGWIELPGVEKQTKGKDIQKKWKNLKDCFSRELATQRKTVSGQAAKKRRKYIYFDQLQFLLPSMQDRATSSNTAPPESEEKREELTLENNKENIEERQTPIRRAVRKKDPCKIPYEEKLLNILENKQTEDEDKNFALMLVPMLKKLSDEQKHYAKIEILNVMRNAKKIHEQESYYSNHPPFQFSQSAPPPAIHHSHSQGMQTMMPSTSNYNTMSRRLYWQETNPQTTANYCTQYSEGLSSPATTLSENSMSSQNIGHDPLDT